MATTGTKSAAQYLRMEIKETLEKCSRLVSYDIDDCYKSVDELPNEDNIRELDRMIDLNNRIAKFINLLEVDSLWEDQRGTNDDKEWLDATVDSDFRTGSFLAAHVAKDFKSSELRERVYSSLNDLAKRSQIGDWISLPDGTAYRCYFKPHSPNNFSD